MIQKINQISWCGVSIDPIYVNSDEIKTIRKMVTSEKPKPFFEIELRDGSIIHTYEFPNDIGICEYCGSRKNNNGCPKCGAP